jgi:hypothetical protein
LKENQKWTARLRNATLGSLSLYFTLFVQHCLRLRAGNAYVPAKGESEVVASTEDSILRLFVPQMLHILSIHLPFKKDIHTVKKVSISRPQPRDVTNQTPPGRE